MSAHPAPFSAYLEGPGFAIASCSPERFLHRRGDQVEARPIKGTVARGDGAAEDAARRQWLAASSKDRAENVMIVDLMRNDLGRVAVTGSVCVPELFALEPYASVWQMVSTVQAQLRADCGIDQLLRACWPPGSMTGAPKIKALQIIEALEPLRRGWYAGSVGYLDCRGNVDLSVVIRTAIVADGRVMLQYGGAVVADSDPAGEWAETVAKGRSLVEVLKRGGAHDGASPRTSLAAAHQFLRPGHRLRRGCDRSNRPKVPPPPPESAVRAEPRPRTSPSEPMRAHRNPSVRAWLDRQVAETLYLTATSLSELLGGIEMLPGGVNAKTDSRRLSADCWMCCFDHVFCSSIEARRSLSHPLPTERAREVGPISVADGRHRGRPWIYGSHKRYRPPSSPQACPSSIRGKRDSAQPVRKVRTHQAPASRRRRRRMNAWRPKNRSQ